jgi:iron complex outermembrane receptor protein
LRWGPTGRNNALRANYTYISDDVQIIPEMSQYAINSLKHQFIMSWDSQFVQDISQQITYRYVERGDAQLYSVLDAKIMARINNMTASITANNILGEVYTETNLVPAPKGNVLLGLSYFID